MTELGLPATLRQLTCPETGRVTVVETPLPSLGPGEVLVGEVLCGLCGTDLMKVYSPGVPKPVQLGHEVVGEVVAVGDGVSRVRVGQRVALAHHVPDYSSHFTRRGSAPMDPVFKASNIDPGGFAQFIRLPAAHVAHTLQPVPDGVPDLRAVFMEPLACCLRALDRCPVQEGESVVVVGVGAVGLLFLPLLRDRSATTLAVDLRPERLALAQEWGTTAAALATQPDLGAWVRDHSGGRGADLVILTVVNQAILDGALAWVRDGGRILLFGTKPDNALSLDFWEIWRREIDIVSSYSATPDLFPRAMAILARPEYELERTISHALPLEEAQAGFDLAMQGSASKVVIHCA
jgi:L-iditol 2-dehydrogenase